FSSWVSATWWLVSTSPRGLTKEPDPPSLKRTLERRTWSSHARAGSKPYRSLSCLMGGLSKVHIPSSARETDIPSNTQTARVSRIQTLRCLLLLIICTSVFKRVSRRPGVPSWNPARPEVYTPKRRFGIWIEKPYELLALVQIKWDNSVR